MDETKNDTGVTTAAEEAGIEDRIVPLPITGRSLSPGLTHLQDSKVPGHDRHHVHGPQQAAVDPVAAGLETDHIPASAAENRVITRTGVIGSGNPESDAVSDGSHVAAPEDDKTPVSPPTD
jgi:hypothetical protein